MLKRLMSLVLMVAMLGLAPVLFGCEPERKEVQHKESTQVKSQHTVVQ